MAKDTTFKGGDLPAHGPISEGVDPLTTGHTTYGEDIKGNSTREDAVPSPEETSTIDESDEVAAEDTTVDEPVADEDVADAADEEA